MLEMYDLISQLDIEMDVMNVRKKERIERYRSSWQ
jgi:hypothetical protein